jgi:hypothetical protein
MPLKNDRTPLMSVETVLTLHATIPASVITGSCRHTPRASSTISR